jgi:hypothetical protein
MAAREVGSWESWGMRTRVEQLSVKGLRTWGLLRGAAAVHTSLRPCPPTLEPGQVGTCQALSVVVIYWSQVALRCAAPWRCQTLIVNANCIGVDLVRDRTGIARSMRVRAHSLRSTAAIKFPLRPAPDIAHGQPEGTSAGAKNDPSHCMQGRCTKLHPVKMCLRWVRLGCASSRSPAGFWPVADPV